MAGIGFELYRILHKGTMGSILKVFFLGTIIVAGPWILSVMSIYVIQKFAYSAISENPILFNVTIVYVYAFSLFFFGGVHYVFSRYIADMLYIEDRISTPTALLTAFLLITVISVISSLLFITFNDFSGLKHPSLYKISLVFLFTTINLIWIMLVYVSLLKEYNMVFLSYIFGVLASIGGVFYLGERYGISGALLGYTAGQFLIIVLLLIVSLRLYPIKKLSFNFELLMYFKKFRYLLLLGMFFNMAIWSDKIIYWFTRGESISGTLYNYYMAYDIPVFIAFISMIPGLVYYLVITEPIFHTAYSKFMKNILQDNLIAIRENKQSMIVSLKTGLGKLTVFQGAWTVGLILNTEQFLIMMGYTTVDEGIMKLLLIAVFFHLLALTLQTYMLYLELRREAVISSFIYMILNTILTIIFIVSGIEMPGLSYLLSAMMTSFLSAWYLYRKVPEIDFLIFIKTV